MTTAVICVGRRGEMLFGGRRVSRDALLLADLAAHLEGRLFAFPFSEKYLRGAGIDPVISDDPFAIAGEGDAVFFEVPPLAPHLARIGQIVRYNFDTVYPIDATLDVDPVAAGYRLTERREFVGKAHENIICEVFTK